LQADLSRRANIGGGARDFDAIKPLKFAVS
jgi:hypothetical protein